MGSKLEVLHLYRRFLRAGGQFADYNLRSYARRRAREAFRQGKDAAQEDVLALVMRARKELEVVERQATISRLYQHEESVIEVLQRTKKASRT